jgi:MoaA/NifB/PqqE/SkfB family radical SAM enzyme
MNIRKITPKIIILILRKIKRYLIIYPEFNYLEFHLTDHCNLNCKGCAHFCPIADKVFADIIDYEKDLQQLKKMFSNIKMIRIMGGEPLLHPDIELFISSTHKYFPKTDLRLVTNGLLLNKMPQHFWDVCLANNIKFDLTIYPPFINQSATWIALIGGYGLEVSHYVADTFFSGLNLNGNSDKNNSFKLCMYNCYFLYKGKLYPCALPALSHYFNSKFNMNIPNNGFVDIYEKNITGWDILDHMEKPIDACKFCSKLKGFKWDFSNREISEWDSAV